MVSLGYILSVSLMSAVLTSAFKFPSDIEQCKYSDSRCLSRVVTDILRTHNNGHRGLGVIPFDPIHIESLVLETIPGSLVDAEFRFKNIDAFGFSAGTVRNLTGFTKEASDLVFVKDHLYPKIVLNGPYSIEGSIFNISLFSQGNCRITFVDLKVMTKAKCTTRERGSRKYLNVDEVELDIEPRKVTFAFENLFNCDKERGDRMNQLLNQNWKSVFFDLKPSLEKTFAKFARNIANGPFSIFPYADLFLKSK